MISTEDPIESKKAYIVTEDLSLVVCRWCNMQRPEIPTDELRDSGLFEQLLEGLKFALEEHCFDTETIAVCTLQRSIFDDLLMKRDTVCDAQGIIDERKKPKEFWVALDDVYPTPLHDKDPAKYNMSITRYVTSAGKPFEGEASHGPRPERGEKNLLRQVRECVDRWEDAKAKYNDKNLQIVLVDDGTFSGETICQVLTEFAEQHVFINSVRLGVAKRKGIDRIASWTPPPHIAPKKGELDRVYYIGASKLCPPIKDWVCERDFFPGVMYGGKVVARRHEDGTVRPLRVGEKRIPVRSQYLYGWGNPGLWASIPEDAQRPFTVAALKLSIILWTKLEQLAGRTILVEDLPAVPAQIYKPPAEMSAVLKRPWIGVLEEELNNLEVTLV